jgi:hypothetical protein
MAAKTFINRDEERERREHLLNEFFLHRQRTRVENSFIRSSRESFAKDCVSRDIWPTREQEK